MAQLWLHNCCNGETLVMNHHHTCLRYVVNGLKLKYAKVKSMMNLDGINRLKVDN